jgi:hypothetical protein
MKVHVFKRSNEHIGKFIVEEVAAIPSRLPDFLASHDVPPYSYLEADGKTWTITGLAPLQLEEGRVSPPSGYSPELSSAAVSNAGERAGSAVATRYRDAYRVGTALVGLGDAIKAVGGILAGIIFIGSLTSGNGPFGGGAVVAGIFLAAIVGILFWVCGVIVGAQGQILRATLDTAVASSHFLTDTDRADAMGLPHSVADRSGM